MTIPPITPLTLDLYGDRRPALHRPRVAAAALIVYALQAIIALGANAFHIYSIHTRFTVTHRAFSLWTVTTLGFTSEFLGVVVLLLFAAANLARAAGNPLPLILFVATGLLDEFATIATRLAYVIFYDPASPHGLTIPQERAFGVVDLLTCGISILSLFGWLLYAGQISRLIRAPALFSATAILAGICLLITVTDVGLVLFRLAAYNGFDMTAFDALYRSTYIALTYSRVVLCILILNYAAILAVRLLSPRNR